MSVRNYFEAAMLVAAMVVGVGLMSCDRATVETTSVKETPSGTKVEKKTVVEHNDGTISKETEERTIQR